MLELAVPEIVVFAAVLVTYLAAAIFGVLQLRSGGDRFKRYLVPLIALGISLEVVVLVFRAIAIKAIPLTGLFESMLVLTVVFGLIYLLFAIPIRQIWFGSVMSWIMFVTTLLTAMVASPASEPRAIAATPWAIAHGVAMVLSAVAIMPAAASAVLHLFAISSLKQKKAVRVLGRVPNVEKLGRINQFGLNACFVFMTFGLVSGFGMAAAGSGTLDTSILDWLIDAKIVMIIAVWVLLAAILILLRTRALKTTLRAYATIAAFVLILFAVIGTSVFCGTKHDFQRDDNVGVEVTR